MLHLALLLCSVFYCEVVYGHSTYHFMNGEGYLESCSFEPKPGSVSPHTCFWYGSPNGAIDWLLTNIPSNAEIVAGLTADHTPTGSGYYWTARRTENNAAGNRAFLEKRVMGGKGKILNFWYHMSGGVGSLTVEKLPLFSDSDSDAVVLFSRQDNQGNQWIKSTDILVADCHDYKIRIEAQLNSIGTSIAIDDITFSDPNLNPDSPGPEARRDNVCWNDATAILSRDELDALACCCQQGFTGAYCQDNIDECTAQHGSGLCLNGGLCLDLVNGFRCSCEDGWAGEFCEEPIDDCADVQCERGARCEDLVNDFLCHCPQGYTGRLCEVDIDDCIGVTCTNGGTCVDRHNGYICDCLVGFSGLYCEVNTNECLSLPCGPSATCIDGPGTYWCLCSPGYTHINGSCVDATNPCTSAPCLYGSRCMDTAAGYECLCTAGTRGHHCEVNINDCLNIECLNGGECVDGFDSYSCDCPLGFSGTYCQVDNRQSLCSTHCSNAAECSFNADSVICHCKPGYTGVRCQHEINECQYNPCVQGVCRDRIAGYYCECDAGWTGSRCDKVVDFCNSSPCVISNSQCYNTPTGPVCLCNIGYTGEYCETKLNPCDRVHCLHGGKCTATGELNHIWHCNCPVSYVGKYCETEVVETHPNEYTAEAQSQVQERVCLDFWTLSDKMKGGIIAVCIACVLLVFIIGAVTIECSIRTIKANRRRSLKSLFKFH